MVEISEKVSHLMYQLGLPALYLSEDVLGMVFRYTIADTSENIG